MSDPSQFTVSVVKVAPSLCLAVIVKLVIGEPPLSGATHAIVIMSESNDVVGETGVAGIYAARILTVFESSLNP